jgi:dTMP kinase
VREALRQVLVDRGFEVVLTREPGGTTGGEAIRELLLHPAGRMCAETELLLMFASRAQLVRELVLPALERGCHGAGRPLSPTPAFAYQGGGRGIPMGQIAELERWAAVVKPDLTFLLDVGVEVGLSRARSRGAELVGSSPSNWISSSACAQAYLARAAAEPGRFRLVDASRSPDEVRADVSRALQAWLDSLS